MSNCERSPRALLPASMGQAGPRELEIVWGDGHGSLYDVVELRRACPCAACVDELTGRRVLDASSIPDDVRPVRIDPVGRYAIQFTWSDGHSTGIFTFELLRSLCGCAECTQHSSHGPRG